MTFKISTTSVLIVLSAIVWFMGARNLMSGARNVQETPVFPVADERYAALRPLLSGKTVVGFTTDRILPHQEGRCFLYATQYALAPIAVIPESPETLRPKLAAGYAVIGDFEDPSLIGRQEPELREWMDRIGMTLEVHRVAEDICLIETKKK
jgi:hypothetical protein